MPILWRGIGLLSSCRHDYTTKCRNTVDIMELPQTMRYTKADTMQHNIWVCYLGTHQQHSCGCFFQQTVPPGTAICWYSCSAEGVQAPWSLCALFHDKCVHFRGPKPSFCLPACFRTYHGLHFSGILLQTEWWCSQMASLSPELLCVLCKGSVGRGPVYLILLGNKTLVPCRPLRKPIFSKDV